MFDVQELKTGMKHKVYGVKKENESTLFLFYCYGHWFWENSNDFLPELSE